MPDATLPLTAEPFDRAVLRLVRAGSDLTLRQAAGIVAAQGAAEAWIYAIAGGAAGAWSLSRVQWFFGE